MVKNEEANQILFTKSPNGVDRRIMFSTDQSDKSTSRSEEKGSSKVLGNQGATLNLPKVYGEYIETPSTPAAIDEMNSLLKSTSEPVPDELGDPPKDRHHLVYIIFLINGISTLMPWNMFITAEQYFVDYKFGGKEEEYSKNFLSYLGLCSQIPNLLLNLINAFAHTGGGLNVRIIASLSVLIAMLLLTIVMAMIDSSTWPGTFFVLTMLTAVVCNGAVGVYQNCVYGMAANFPMKYSGAVVLGSNISGTLTSFISLISMILAPNLKMAAIYYFTTALLIVLLSLDSYFLLPHCKYYKYHKCLHRVHTSAVNLQMGEGIRSYLKPYIDTFKQVWVQMFNIFFLFFVSLSIFPALQVGVEPVDENFFLAGRFFTSITCFIFFNTFAMIGNIIPGWIKNPGPNYLWIPILLRGLLIPLFMMCNYRPVCRSWPVLINSDLVYSVMSVFLGFSSGYFSSLIMMYTPKLVDKAHARIAAMLATFFLILGIVCGINNTLLLAYVTENLGPVNRTSSLCYHH